MPISSLAPRYSRSYHSNLNETLKLARVLSPRSEHTGFFWKPSPKPHPSSMYPSHCVYALLHGAQHMQLTAATER
jgi:hypothetical protein